MDPLPSDITDLFNAMTVEEMGCESGMPFVGLGEETSPSLLFLASEEGKLLHFDDLEGQWNVERVASLARDLAHRLKNRGIRAMEVETSRGKEYAVGALLCGVRESLALGCVMRADPFSGDDLEEVELALMLCRGFAEQYGSTRNRVVELQTRVEHLLAEHETLKISHTEAASQAIGEREKRLQEQEEHTSRLQAIMMMAADGIITVDEHGMIESFNEMAGEIFGYSSDEVFGKNIAMLVPFAHRSRHPNYLADYFQSGDSEVVGRRREVTGLRKDGRRFPMELAVSKIFLGERRIFTAILRDITERKSLESQLIQAQKLESIGQLAAGVAHEINTPTQYIGDNARFLQESFEDLRGLLEQYDRLFHAAREHKISETLLADVETVVEEADLEYLLEEMPKAIRQSLEGIERVASIVRSMKEFSHPGGQGMQTVDLNRALENTLTVSRNEWKYVAEAVTDLDPALPLVKCLPGECNQVFLNLIINAAHAIAERKHLHETEKGTITVRTRSDGRWAEVRVIDTGIGIREEDLPRLFDPFFTTKEVGKGTGQGLAIAHAIVTEKHGGTISVETKLGHGTTFIVRLPIDGRSRGDKT